MPTYDYGCTACGTRFEVSHGIAASGPDACPTCGGGPVRKAFAPPAILFKGAGWAKVDRRSAARSSKPTSGEGSAASTDAATASSDGGSTPSSTTPKSDSTAPSSTAAD